MNLLLIKFLAQKIHKRLFSLKEWPDELLFKKEGAGRMCGRGAGDGEGQTGLFYVNLLFNNALIY